jgi:hypothetical protein
MITLVKDQELATLSEYRVFADGEYENTDLVEVYHINNPSLALCAFQAYFVVNGVNFEE